MTPEDRLARLRSGGADRFDPLGVRLIAGLLARAASAGGGVAGRIRARAEERIAALEEALARGRAEAEARVAALAEEGHAIEAPLGEALASGDFVAVRRDARRMVKDRALAAQVVSVPGIARVVREAGARGLDVPDLGGLAGIDVDRGVVSRAARPVALAIVHALSRALFRESADRARAALLVARATDNVPEAAGPYNAQVLSARTLAALADLSPRYLRALIAELDDLAGARAALDRLPRAEKSARRRRDRPTAR